MSAQEQVTIHRDGKAPAERGMPKNLTYLDQIEPLVREQKRLMASEDAIRVALAVVSEQTAKVAAQIHALERNWIEGIR